MVCKKSNSAIDSGVANSHNCRTVKRRYRSLADYFEQTKRTQASLAEALDVDRSYLSLIASGQRQPSLDLALRIERETGVPVETLVAQEQAS